MKWVGLLAAGLIALSVAPVYADGGGVSGYVRDSMTRQGVPGADVLLSGPLGLVKTTTNAHGFYSFLGLVPGPYTLEATKIGYESPICLSSRTSIELHSDQVQSATVWLHNGPIVISMPPRCPKTRPAPMSFVDASNTADVYYL